MTSSVHDRADRRGRSEQDEELVVLDPGVAEHALVILVAAGAGSSGRKLPHARAASHCSAVSEVRAGSRGVRVWGVGPLISSARLETASLLGWPDSERT